jgi:hypothetical protein
VYTTDHENYFGEVELRGTLSELFAELFTDEELEREVADALAEME